MDLLPRRGTFWQLIVARAQRTPERTFAVDDRGRSLTFGELRRHAELVAGGLHQRDVGPGSVVAWQLPTWIESVVLMGALARLGAVQVPLIPLLREREVGFIVEQTGAQLLIGPEQFRDFDHGAMLRRIGPPVLRCEPGWPLPVGDPSALPPHRDMVPPARQGRSGLCRWIFYTSGTTAEPKGVRHTDASVMASADGMFDALTLLADDVFPVPFPIAHIGGALQVTAALRAGCRHLYTETFDAERSPQFFAAQGATILGSGLPFIRAYVAAQLAHGREPLFPRLRYAMCGGAPKPPGLHDEVRATLGGAGVLSSWGLTECPVATGCAPGDPHDALAYSEGAAITGVDLRVVDGELRVRGPMLFEGYVDAALDADAFDDEGYLRTGDLGEIGPTGHVRVTGRIKDVILRHGETISAKEIEDVLDAHPSIADVAVVGVPDEVTGERICAAIHVRSGRNPPTVQDLVAWCQRQGLARHKAPAEVMILDAIPRNAMGKAVKTQIRSSVPVRSVRSVR
jgi:cyclohexanecarboxylate-CoA ligase